MIIYQIVGAQQIHDAYNWHRGFSAANNALFPRSRDDFKLLIEDRKLWCALRKDTGDLLGLSYASFDEKEMTWEIGGLMVATQERGKGIGLTIMRLTLAHLLFEESPINFNHSVIAHVLETNKTPRSIIEKYLKFRHSKSVEIPGNKLPGLKTNDAGNVVGDEFEITIPDTLHALAEWCDNWKNVTKDGEEVIIKFREGIGLSHWSQAFHDYAD